MKFLSYFPPPLAFATMLIGMRTSAMWNARGVGIDHLLPEGRALVLVGFLAMLASLYLTWRSHRESNEVESQKLRIRALGHLEVRLAVREITQPFYILFWSGDTWGKQTLVPDTLANSDSIALAKMVDIRKDVCAYRSMAEYERSLTDKYAKPEKLGGTWWQFIEGRTQNGLSMLTQALQIYSPYIEPEVLELISRLRLSEYLGLRLCRVKEHVEMNKMSSCLSIPYPEHGMDFGWTEFWEIITALDRALQKDGDRLMRAVTPEPSWQNDGE